MDAYDLQQTLFVLWQRLSKPSSGTSASKDFPDVPVYVEVDGKLLHVVGIKNENNKILLETKK